MMFNPRTRQSIVNRLAQLDPELLEQKTSGNELLFVASFSA
jgi:hypothetical protein